MLLTSKTLGWIVFLGFFNCTDDKGISRSDATFRNDWRLLNCTKYSPMNSLSRIPWFHTLKRRTAPDVRIIFIGRLVLWKIINLNLKKVQLILGEYYQWNISLNTGFRSLVFVMVLYSLQCSGKIDSGSNSRMTYRSDWTIEVIFGNCWHRTTM